jgi:trk system potassium uptake protein
VRIVIVGCGRVGAGLAERFARAGHEVTIVDTNSEAFTRLESDFPGQAIRADGTDEDVLRRIGTDGADMFFSLTEGDNRNVLAAQLATETFRVRQVVAKINDPVRAEAYTALGVATICRTRLLIDALARFAGMESDPGASGVRVPTGLHDAQPPAAVEGEWLVSGTTGEG